MPKEYVAEGLLEALAGHDLRGKSILIPRARVARDVIPRVLEERGARVEVVEAYQTVVPEISRERARSAIHPAARRHYVYQLLYREQLCENCRGGSR